MKHLLLTIVSSLLLWSCNDTDELSRDVELLQQRLAEIEEQISGFNDEIIGVHQLMKTSTVVVGVTADSKGYVVELSDGTSVTVFKGAEIEYTRPIYGVDADGYWIVSTDGGENFVRVTDKEGKPLEANPADGDNGENGATGVTPRIRVDGDGFWQASYDDGASWVYVTDEADNRMSAMSGKAYSGFFSDVVYDAGKETLTLTTLTGKTVTLNVVSDFKLAIAHEKDVEPFLAGEKRSFAVEQTGVREALVKVPAGWTAILSEKELEVTAPGDESRGCVKVVIVSEKGYMRSVSLEVSSSYGTPAWQAFHSGSEDNVLLDFSYAGYKHGEVAPPDVSTLGYEIFNVVDYGAVANDGKSDRKAFIAAVEAMIKKGSGIVYFPEGEFDLHAAGDDETAYSQDIIINAGNWVLKGAGRDKTTILMSAPNTPKDEAVMYSSAVMINIKHNSGLNDITTVTGDAAKGAHAVEVSSTVGLKAGDWVCLYLANNDPELVKQELGSQERFDNINITGYQIVTEGVTVYDYHQIASISGNSITFVEPIMHAVESKWGWKIMKYNHYENVGVEDITFKGNAKEDFVHHGSWADDGAYKPINLMRLTNSWMRRVRFTSVSECSSIVSCANVSVYDVEIDGNRGHSAIRSQGSSRVFIGKVVDKSSGPAVDNASNIMPGAGQYHAVGVSKPSMGAVLWRNQWGKDGCFESHATQPRATLIDCCTGAMLKSRQGGDNNQMPNHLDDLTIWNFNETVCKDTYIKWWDMNSKWWKFMPPTIVGYKGQVTFDPATVKLDEGHGANVQPESLYEAQLIRRLGALPAWLLELK